MPTVSVRDLRNKGAEVLRRVEAGEEITVTRDGEPVALLVPLDRKPLSLAALIERRRHLPKLDPMDLRRDIDATIDDRLF